MFELHANPEGLSYTPTAAGHAWVLPARKNLGKLRLLGLIPLALSLVIPLVFGLFARGFMQGLGGPAWLHTLGPLLIGGLVFLGEWKFWRFGVAILMGRAEVRVEGENLVAVERMPFRSWKRTIPMSAVTKVEVAGPTGAGGDCGEAACKPGKALSDLFGITVYENGEKRALAVGYPLAMLQPLAVQVADHVNSGRAEPVPVEVFCGTLDELREKNRADEAPPEPEPVPERPADSKAVVTENNGELSIELPPAGLMKGSKGLFGMAVFWNLLIVAIAVGFVIASIRGNGPKGEEVLILVGVLALFGSVGVWLLVSSVSMGKRFTILDVVGDSLLISTTTPFRSRQHTFLAEDLRSIKAGPSGTEINDVPVLELQIRHSPTSPETGRSAHAAKLGLLSSRSDEELRWLAALLTERLGLTPPPPEPDRGPGVHLRMGRSD